jgi:hypothetical protein
MNTLPLGMAMGGAAGVCFACARAQSLVSHAAVKNTYRYFRLPLDPGRVHAVAIIASCLAYAIVGALLSAWIWSASRAVASLVE